MKRASSTLILVAAVMAIIPLGVLAGEIFSTSFEQDNNGEVILEDHGMDMVLRKSIGGGPRKGYYWLNNNEKSRQALIIQSAGASFKPGKTYTIEFTAGKLIDNDHKQKEITVSAGSATREVTVNSKKQTCSVTVDADKDGLAGQPLIFQFQAAGVTRGGVNQYWLYDVTISEN